MKINTRTSLVGFLLALSTLNVATATASTQDGGIKQQGQTIEARLNHLTAAIKARETQLQDSAKPGQDQLIAQGFANRRGGGGFANRRGGGGFVNVNPWRNGWGDGGGFLNFR